MGLLQWVEVYKLRHKKAVARRDCELYGHISPPALYGPGGYTCMRCWTHIGGRGTLR